MKFYYTLLFLLTTVIFYGQSTTLSGNVLDDANGKSMPGVNISIKSLKLNTSSDSEGKFIFRKVPYGVYDVEFSFIGYDSKIISDVTFSANETPSLNVSLVERKNNLQEVVITRTKAKAESVKSLLLLQKNSVSVSDGISAETIKRTPDKTTSDVIKRISGASIQDNKFVIIRGLNDRYNAAFLNGAPLPSSESDRKAFSFDIFPSNMLDNLLITKTASPDLPGDFAGGVIQINTKSVPDKDFQSISVGSGYNTITTFKEQKTYKGSGTDWLGFDNGARALPSSIPDTDFFSSPSTTDADKANVAKSFETDWSIKNSTFKPNTNFQYSLGRHFDIKDKVFGIMFSISNSQTNNFNSITRIDYENPKGFPAELNSVYNDKNYSQQVLTAGLANFSLKFNPNHSLTFKNIYSINSTDLVVERYGQKEVTDTRFISSNVRWFTSNKIYSGQLNGEHYFATPKIKLNWTGFFSNIERSIPNLRRNVYSIADPTSADPALNTPVANIASNNGGADYGGGMFFSENSESIMGGKFDVSKKFKADKNFSCEVKVGGFAQLRDRDFFARQLQYNIYNFGGTFDNSLLELPNSSIFSKANMGTISPGVNGFTLYDATKYTDKYNATADLYAAYGMFDFNFFETVRLVAGVRAEDYKQTLKARLTEFDYLNQVNKQTDILPSANLIISLDKTQNLRFSFSKTVNRPEFRELAPFGFYDFTNGYFTEGNKDLKIAKIDNFDFRYELYPGKGQIFSFSYFRKNFENPIEIKNNVNQKSITYANATSATNSGVELEFRTLLSSLFDYPNAAFLDDLTLFSNLAVIKSKVNIDSFNANSFSGRDRALQGQSPYIINAGLQYSNKDAGLTISANANKAGNRIFIAENELYPTIWEKGRTFLDIQVAKTFYNNKIEIKLNIQNLLAQDLIFYQNDYRNISTYSTLETLGNLLFTGDNLYEDGYNKAEDEINWKVKNGRVFSLSMTYNF